MAAISPRPRKTPAMKRIGIITRTVDRPILLERTLRSLTAQTCQDWEWIIVTPNPAPVQLLLDAYAAALAGRARVLTYHQPMPGMRGSPLNHAIAHSTTEFLIVLDDDDTWHPECLAALSSLLASPTGQLSGGAVCQTLVIEETSVADGLVPIRDYPLNPTLRSLTLAHIAIVNPFCIHAFLYRRSSLTLTGLYPEDYPVLEDWHFNLRFLRHHDIVVLPRILTYYHQRPGTCAGPEANSLHAEVDLHKFHEARLINQQIREDLAAALTGPGALLAAGAHVRLMQDQIHHLESKIKTISEKTGKIDARTKELKQALPRSR